MKCWNYPWIRSCSQGRLLSVQNPAWAGCSRSLQTKQGTEQEWGFFFLVDLSYFDISPWDFLLGHSWRFQVFWEQFSCFSTLYSLVSRNLSCKSSSLQNVGVSGSNGSGGNSLQVQNSLGCAFEIPGTGGREIQGYPGIQSAQFGIQGWGMGRVDPHFCLSLDWEFRSCKLNSNRSFLHFKSLKKSTQGWLGKHLCFCGET